MKRCGKCSTVYNDESLNFCLEDGEWLETDVDSGDHATAILNSRTGDDDALTRRYAPENASPTESLPATPNADRSGHRLLIISGIAVLILGLLGFAGYRFYQPEQQGMIRSIAVMPFANDSGVADLEYLSEGMADELINSLSKIPNLSVKARSTVFRYKGQAVEPVTVGKDLSVQAILNGRVVQRGDDLAVYLSLVDTTTGDQIWGESYQRKLADLITLQKKIINDVSSKLQLKLSGAESQLVTKNYTQNAEAYQLYLKGRHHLLKSTPLEIDKSITYFQQAIDIDPSYAMAYVGLADGYRAPGAERFPADALTKAKSAVQAAIKIDDSLSEAHGVLGFIIFWYEWNFTESEKECRRAIELDPKNADAHLFLAHLLSNLGRRDEALAEARRARELDPLNVRTNALEGQFLLHAGRLDEALERFKATKELDPNNWMAHLFSTSAYIEKGMYAEAIAEGRRTNEIQPHSRSFSFLGYALAKSGDPEAARKELNRMLEQSHNRWISPYSVAMVYQGLEDREQTLKWLERGLAERDPRMVFLKAEPKWDSIRNDERFKRVYRAVGLPE